MDGLAIELLAAGSARVQYLIYAEAVDGSGSVVGFAVSDDAVDLDLTVDGIARVYTALEGGFALGQITYGVGTEIRSLEIRFAQNAAVDALFRSYQISGAPVVVHRAAFDQGGALLAVGRVWSGLVDDAPIVDDPNGAYRAMIVVSDASRQGTLTLGGYKSDASQRLRSTGDTFFQYGSIAAGAAADTWRG